MVILIANAGLAALMIPVNLPPAIYRLDLVPELLSKPPKEVGLYARNTGHLEYKADFHNAFLRTNDFTPQNAFGRSFAYR